ARGLSLVDTRKESFRARLVLTVDRSKGPLEQRLLCTRAQVAADRHQRKRHPEIDGRYPHRTSQRQQVETQIDRMPHETERPVRRKLVALVESGPKTPRSK